MSSSNTVRPLSLTLWYATLFIAGSLLIVLLTYVLTSTSLAQRDRQIIQAKVGEYAAVYARGGLRALAATVQAEQRTAPERLFVRVQDNGAEAIVLSDQQGWDLRSLETASVVLGDGTLVQVGKSTDARRDILSRFRATLLIVTLSIVVVALTGGWIATQSALAPIRGLSDAVRRVIATGKIDARVEIPAEENALAELIRLFNEMLGRIEGLVGGMRGALDSVSHDLRTPLTRLRGTAELALAGAADPERYREALADCVEECDRVLFMLNTLMDISEAESGAMPLNRERVRLADLVARAVDLYTDAAEAKEVALVVGPASDVAVVGDRVRLEQVAANLVDNAVKYTPPGGRVVIAASQDARGAVLTVQDSGPGIAAADLPHVWDRLFRGDSSRSTRGLGLGLSLVKAIVEAHKGTVSVDSTPGQGATFTMVLPAAPFLSPM